MLLKDVISCNLLNCYFLDFENYVDNILNIFVPTVPGLKRKISFSKSCNQSKECRNVQSCNSICKNLVVYPKSFPSFWFVWMFVCDVYIQLFLLFTFLYHLTQNKFLLLLQISILKKKCFCYDSSNFILNKCNKSL